MSAETGLQKAHRLAAERRAAGEQPVRKDPLQKARENPTSLRKAVTAKCWDCVGAGADPNPRAEIRECPDAKCPLHPVRPYQRKQHEKPQTSDDRAIPATHALL